MMPINGKTKIILLVVGFIMFSGLMYWFGYGVIGTRTQVFSDAINTKKVELEVLQREQKSFEEGKKDLAEVAKSAYPPSELFSNDTKVVKEIQQLEATAQKYSLDMTLSVSGTAEEAVKVPGTAGDLYSIPYTISLAGPFQSAMQFMQIAEHLPFISHVKQLTVSASSKDTRTVITSEFYIKK